MSKREILIWVILALVLSLSYIVGYQMGRKSVKVTTIEKVINRERIVEKPVVKDSIVYKDKIVYLPKYITETVHDSAFVTDTVFEPVPFEEKIYGDSTYTAQVSGYQPSLDWIKIHQHEILRETFVEKNPHWSLTIGPSIGYSFLPERQPYIGVGIAFGYSLKNF